MSTSRPIRGFRKRNERMRVSQLVNDFLFHVAKTHHLPPSHSQQVGGGLSPFSLSFFSNDLLPPCLIFSLLDWVAVSRLPSKLGADSTSCPLWA